MSAEYIDEDVVCKHCGARSRAGFIASETMACEETGNDFRANGYHDWVPVDRAHEYDIEVDAR